MCETFLDPDSNKPTVKNKQEEQQKFMSQSGKQAWIFHIMKRLLLIL